MSARGSWGLCHQEVTEPGLEPKPRGLPFPPGGVSHRQDQGQALPRPVNKDFLLFPLRVGSSRVPCALCPLLASQATQFTLSLSKLLPWFRPLPVDGP